MCQQDFPAWRHNVFVSRKEAVHSCSCNLCVRTLDRSRLSAPCLVADAKGVSSTCTKYTRISHVDLSNLRTEILHDTCRACGGHALTCSSPASGFALDGTSCRALTPASTKVLPKRADAEPWQVPIKSHMTAGSLKSLEPRPSCLDTIESTAINVGSGLTISYA